MLSDKLTNELIRCSTKVYNILGFGFFWEIYGNALYIELNNKNIKYRKLVSFPLKYKNSVVGNFTADMVVEDRIIIQLARGDKIELSNELQMKNFLRASGMEKGIILNFGHQFTFIVLEAPETVKKQGDMFNCFSPDD